MLKPINTVVNKNWKPVVLEDIKHPLNFYIVNVLISFVFLVMTLIALFFSSDLIKDISVKHPEYLSIRTSYQDINLGVTFTFIIVIIILINFIFYLIRSSNSHLKLEIWEKTKTLSFAKQQFMRLYESAPVPYLKLDKDGNIHEPNKAALRFFGVFPNDLIGKNFFSYISGDFKDKASDFLRLYKLNMPIDRGEAQMLTNNNLLKSVMISVFDMRGPGSVNREGLAIIIDITEQKNIEKAKTEFLSLASHQLKTPLTTTMWYSEMLLTDCSEGLTEEQKKYINIVHLANQNMIETVEVLLNISRLEMGSMAMDKISTNVAELSASVLKELSLQITNKKININLNYNNLFTDIKSDPKFLRIVIQNLVSNAVKYTPDGGTVTISFEDSVNEKRIVVSDTGYGIPLEQQDRIFSKLFRADNVKNLSTVQGTGLGLYLVKSMMTSMGGDIRFTSEENKGSTFTIIL